MNLLALILMLFTGGDEEKTKEISETLGLDLNLFTQTLKSVQSGKVTASTAAANVYTSIDHDKVNWSKAANIDIGKLTGREGPTILHPDLAKKIESDPKVAQMVEWTFAAADREGIDGNLLANQFWQESKFNPNAQSGVGAKGVAQFMPFHKGKWGLDSAQDFFDPKTSIDAGAKFMSYLTERTGSQRLALVAYNGGEKAIKYVEKNMSGDGNITIDDWMAFMDHERDVKGVGSRNLWRNQTFEYVAKIDSSYWDPKLLQRANQSTNQLAFNGGGVREENSEQPSPLPFNGKGVDLVAAAQQADAAVQDNTINSPSTSQTLTS